MEGIVIKTKLDDVVELEAETIDLTLIGVSDAFKIGASNTNALSISATDATAQVKITDTPIVSIVANQTINENDPQLQIITSVAINEVITVNLSIESGTAVAGKDFVANTRNSGYDTSKRNIRNYRFRQFKHRRCNNKR